MSETITATTQHATVALVGNPNTGKSTLFNALTGYRQRVGNYPGVTVARRTGTLQGIGDDTSIKLIDLPGAYSLGAQAADEAIVLDALLGHPGTGSVPDLIVVVVDAGSLARNLFFTTQILEVGRPVVVALNMVDVAESAGIDVDCVALAKELGVPVVPLVATRGQGIERLRDAIVAALQADPSDKCANFPDCVCAEIDGLTESVARQSEGLRHPTSRIEALQTLLEPGGYHERRVVQRCGKALAEELSQRRRRIEDAGESVVEVEARVRYAWIARVLEHVVTRSEAKRLKLTDRFDRVLTHRVFGLAMLLLVMGGVFQTLYAFAGPVMDAIDVVVGTAGTFVTGVLPAGPLTSLIVNGVIAGVGAVLVFLPQILLLFLFIAILEDCGYMARAAFLLDRWMALVGLNGQSFIPLLSSFACAIPGILATRTIANRGERFATILVAPLMSCSARLPVYVLLIGAFIPATPLLGGVVNLQAVMLIFMHMIGVAVAIPVVIIAKRWLRQGEETPSFLMELPSYKWPSPGTVLYRAYEQGREFCVSAGTIIFAVTIVVWAMGYYPRSATMAATFEAQRTQAVEDHGSRIAQLSEPNDSAPLAAIEADLETQISEINREEAASFLQHSLLGRLGHLIEPIVEPLGWDWRIGTAAIAAFPAREVVIATMGTIYGLGEKQDETSVGLRQKLHSATWPDGRPVFSVAVAMSLMVFFALCCQCSGTLAAIRRETNSWRWPLLTFSYMTALAYVAALATYQIAIRV